MHDVEILDVYSYLHEIFHHDRKSKLYYHDEKEQLIFRH